MSRIEQPQQPQYSTEPSRITERDYNKLSKLVLGDSNFNNTPRSAYDSFITKTPDNMPNRFIV